MSPLLAPTLNPGLPLISTYGVVYGVVVYGVLYTTDWRHNPIINGGVVQMLPKSCPAPFSLSRRIYQTKVANPPRLEIFLFLTVKRDTQRARAPMVPILLLPIQTHRQICMSDMLQHVPARREGTPLRIHPSIHLLTH